MSEEYTCTGVLITKIIEEKVLYMYVLSAHVSFLLYACMAELVSLNKSRLEVYIYVLIRLLYQMRNSCGIATFLT